jgi:hypothetical protein
MKRINKERKLKMNNINGFIQWLSKRRSTKKLLILLVITCLAFSGCEIMNGYSNEFIYPEDVSTVYVEMFDNQSFYRGIEYELTDALAKRIEVETPYKVVSNPEHADTIINGKITSVAQSTLSAERQTGRALEKEVELRAVVTWKNLKTGQLLVNNSVVGASATYSEWQQQTFNYASSLAANNMARKIVELMEKQW